MAQQRLDHELDSILSRALDIFGILPLSAILKQNINPPYKIGIRSKGRNKGGRDKRDKGEHRGKSRDEIY